jgi:hypothetical protein
MNIQRDPDAILAEWLEEGPTVLPEPTRRAIAVVTRTANQTRRPIWMPLRRPSMNPYARIAVVATVLVLLVGGALYALTPTNNGVGSPPGSPALSTPAPSPTPSPASPSAATSSATSFTSAAFKVPIGFTLSDGWSIATDEQGEVSLEHGAAVAAIMSLDSTTVRGATSTAPWVPWPDDVHAWLAGRPEFSPTAARTGVVGGRPAVIVDADYVREKITDHGDWLKYGKNHSDGYNMKGSGPGSVHLVVVKTGPKSGLVVMMDGPTDTFGGASASLDRILGTLTFR